MNGADGRPIATALAPIARQSDHRRTGPPESERHRSHRVVPDGKHLGLHGRPFRIRGVTYGSFAVRTDGEAFPSSDRGRQDFAMMAAARLNTVRTYSTPPVDVLELAEDACLRLLVGLHYQDWRSVPQTRRQARRRILDARRRALECAMERCAGRDSVLAIAVGNEVPADLVRLHGIGAVEETLSRLVEEVHEADADLLASYCHYPMTEYLHFEGQDIVRFNVFLERPDQLRAYLRHLQVVSGDLPLLVTELGLASKLHGKVSQAHSLDCQLREVDECGCAGATVFSWTDDWVVAGYLPRSWGRLRARPLAPLRSAKPWSGDRLSWLAEVERELARMGCSYRRASPFESFDLEVSLVGLAVCRVTTAVVWSWLPRFRVIVRPGRLMLPVAAAGALVGLAGRLLGTAVLAMAAAAAAVEDVLLWHLVRQVVVQTSRGTR